MREQPWHVRQTATQHLQWYRNLVDLHALTLEWLKELNVERPAHFLRKNAGNQIAETLWMLEPLADAGANPDASLDKLLDDTSPDDLLGRLEHTVHMVQAWTLSALLDQTMPDELSTIRKQLEQSSWKAGRNCGQARWPALDPICRHDLRGILAAFRGCPLSGRADEPSWLEVRAVRSDLQLELLRCPHNSPFPETRVAADALCEFQVHWTRGFVHSLNPAITIDYQRAASKPGGRCVLKWRLPTA